MLWLMAVTATLPLLVEIGNQLPTTLWPDNDSWVEWMDSGFWDLIQGDEERDNFTFEETEQGFLVVTPRYPRVNTTATQGQAPFWRARTAEHFSLIGSEMYWKWEPPTSSYPPKATYPITFWENHFVEIQDDSSWFYLLINVYHDDYTPPATPTVRQFYIEGDFGTYSYGPVDFDPSLHRWIRVVCDESGQECRVQTAGSGGEAWVTRMTYPLTYPANEERNAVRATFVYQLDTASPLANQTAISADYPGEAGWISPINYQPIPRELPLLVDIGDPLVTRVTKTLPLLVDIGDPSP